MGNSTSSNLQAIVDRENPSEDVLIVRSPAVGLYSHHPKPGSSLASSGLAGRLLILNRTHDLVLPAGVSGLVGKVEVDDKVAPVEYGQILFQLHQRGLGQLAGEGIGTAVAVTPGAVEGTPVPSPTDGVFYLRLNPNAEPYVRVGSRVVGGQTLGLVEVMKSFNPIKYGGPGLPPEAEIVEICAQNGAEIKSGQILFLVR